MFVCVFIQGSYFANQILHKIKLMYQQYLYYCLNAGGQRESNQYKYCQIGEAGAVFY